MRGQYILDDSYKLKKAKTSGWVILRRILIGLLASLSMAVLYYILFAMVFSTDEEKRLRQENRAYAEGLPTLEEKERLLSDVVEGLIGTCPFIVIEQGAFAVTIDGVIAIIVVARRVVEVYTPVNDSGHDAQTELIVQGNTCANLVREGIVSVLTIKATTCILINSAIVEDIHTCTYAIPVVNAIDSTCME